MIAQIGPITSLLETAATAVGAGMVLGSVAAAIRGLGAGWPSRAVERRAVSGGYAGGAVGALSILVDVLIRYGVPR